MREKRAAHRPILQQKTEKLRDWPQRLPTRHSLPRAVPPSQRRCWYVRAAWLDAGSTACVLGSCPAIGQGGWHTQGEQTGQSMQSPSGPIHTGREHANLRTIPLMLLVSSVDTLIRNSRFHLLAFALASSVDWPLHLPAHVRAGPFVPNGSKGAANAATPKLTGFSSEKLQKNLFFPRKRYESHTSGLCALTQVIKCGFHQ